MSRLWLLACLLLALPWYGASAAATSRLATATQQPVMPPSVATNHTAATQASDPHTSHVPVAAASQARDCHDSVASQAPCPGQTGMAGHDSGKVHCPSCLTPVADLPDLTQLTPRLTPPLSEPLRLTLSRYLDHVPGVPSPPPTRAFL